jgi:aromatic ring-cleaving dioxygenase
MACSASNGTRLLDRIGGAGKQGRAMNVTVNTPRILNWHAHVYFDAASRDAASALREAIERSFPVQMGRFHEKPVGPHPRFSFQVAFDNDQLAPLLSWLTLNRGDLTIFIHPNTGNALEDHRDRAIWIGRQVPLILDFFTQKS